MPDVPVALMSKDYHSLWVNSAALAGRTRPLEVPGGVVEPSGILRENAAWAFRDRYVRPTVEEMLEASREGMRVAASRGVVAIHDKDGWLGAFEVFERLLEAGELDVRVWQSFPWDRLDDLRSLGLRSGFGNGMLRLGYLKGFMDGTLGSATARLLDGSGVEISSREVLEDVVRRGAAAGLAGGRARDRRRRQPRGARRLRGHPRRLGAGRPAAARRARAAPGRRRRVALRRARRDRVGAVQPRALGPGSRGTALGGPRRAPTRTARCSTPARSS